MARDLTSPVLNDSSTLKDFLRFEPYCDTLFEIITDSETQTPLTIGIFAPWGAGKTSLMRMIENKMIRERTLCHSVWFDAWKYEKEEVLWRALILRVLSVVRQIIEEKIKVPTTKEQVRLKSSTRKLRSQNEAALKMLDDLEASMYRAIDREDLGNLQINWHELLKGSLETAVHVGVALIPGLHIVQAVAEEVGKKAATDDPGRLLQAIEREKTKIHIDHINSLEQFQQNFEKLINDYILQDGNLVIFIDDLDRCLPEKAIGVLEAIKLFLDARGCIFIIGMDQEVITSGIRVKYKDYLISADGSDAPSMPIDGRQYLEKIIQLPFILPPIGPGIMTNYIQKLVPNLPDSRCKDVFSLGLASNPRQVKRAINVFLLLWKLVQRKKRDDGHISIDPLRLAKLVVIQHTYPGLYKLVSRFPQMLKELEKYFREDMQWQKDNQDARSDTNVARPEPPSPLHSFAEKDALRQILTLHPVSGEGSKNANFIDMTPNEIKKYVYLTTQYVSDVVDASTKNNPFQPLMVRIPAGIVKQGTAPNDVERIAREYEVDKSDISNEIPQHEIRVPEFEVSKFPITNFEYQLFVLDKGGGPPFHWDNAEIPPGLDDHPVVNVSWYDAENYCKWLSEKTGEVYRLLSETEWERVARGESIDDFPFGAWDSKKCNTMESGIGQTNSMGHFSPTGDSPLGAMDVAGNVWEWTMDWYKPYPGSTSSDESFGEKYKVLRGGSFGDPKSSARCARRGKLDPNARSKRVGFRCCKNVRNQ